MLLKHAFSKVMNTWANTFSSAERFNVFVAIDMPYKRVKIRFSINYSPLGLYYPPDDNDVKNPLFLVDNSYLSKVHISCYINESNNIIHSYIYITKKVDITKKVAAVQKCQTKNSKRARVDG